MSEQVFISYRRKGGDVTAKLICESLKRKGYNVFYDFDSIDRGRFDSRIFTAIDNCNDFIVVLSPGALDNCQKENDWVRWEIRHALECRKNIIPVLLPGFDFPSSLPEDISEVRNYSGVPFVMAYYDGVIDAIIKRFLTEAKAPVLTQKQEDVAAKSAKTAKKKATAPAVENDETKASVGLKYESLGYGYKVVGIGKCKDQCIVIPKTYSRKPVVAVGDLMMNADDNQKAIASQWVKEIIVPDGVTEICSYAFYGFKSLEKLTLPGSIKTLGNSFICQDTNKSIVFGGTMKDWRDLRRAGINTLRTYIGGNFLNLWVECKDGKTLL